jgi:hypothetical protein
MQKSGKSTPKRDQFHKVPASGEVVNDGRQTALLHGKDSGFGSRLRTAGAEFCPELARIQTKRRFFPLYQKRTTDITIAALQ